MRNIIKYIFSILIFCFIINTAFSRTYTWNKTGGGDWSVKTNWSPVSGPPGISDDAVFPNNITGPITITNVPFFVNSITINTSTTLNLLIAGGTLFINNLIINGGNFTFGSGTNINVYGTLTMTSGNIITGSNLLTLGLSSIIPGSFTYTSGNIITGNSGGFVRWFDAATVSNVIFPVGTSSNLNKIT